MAVRNHYVVVFCCCFFSKTSRRRSSSTSSKSAIPQTPDCFGAKEWKRSYWLLHSRRFLVSNTQRTTVSVYPSSSRCARWAKTTMGPMGPMGWSTRRCPGKSSCRESADPRLTDQLRSWSQPSAVVIYSAEGYGSVCSSAAWRGICGVSPDCWIYPAGMVGNCPWSKDHPRSPGVRSLPVVGLQSFDEVLLFENQFAPLKYRSS